MTVRKAVKADVPRLLELRLGFLFSIKGFSGDEAFAASIREYLEKHISDGSAVVWLAEAEGQIVSCAFLCCFEELPTAGNPTGRAAYIHNVCTAPEYRRQGLAETLVKACVSSAWEWGAGQITLGATEQGKPLYEKLGFQVLQDEMRLKAEPVSESNG